MKLKICGIRDIDILKYTCDIGVDFAGFIMVDDSPRKISNDFISSLKNFDFQNTLPVFVFVNPSIDEVKKITTIIQNPILQFHGDETEDFCKQFNLPFWKTIRVQNSQSLKLLKDYASADAFLFETYVDDSYGGTGKVFDWNLLKNTSLDKNYVLAGGISSKNIKEAISLNPWCIDVNSGVESSLAIKDKALMAQIKNNFKNE
jgi:phosphoribosylanthranilate isomerase